MYSCSLCIDVLYSLEIPAHHLRELPPHWLLVTRGWFLCLAHSFAKSRCPVKASLPCNPFQFSCVPFSSSHPELLNVFFGGADNIHRSEPLWIHVCSSFSWALSAAGWSSTFLWPALHSPQKTSQPSYGYSSAFSCQAFNIWLLIHRGQALSDRNCLPFLPPVSLEEGAFSMGLNVPSLASPACPRTLFLPILPAPFPLLFHPFHSLLPSPL